MLKDYNKDICNKLCQLYTLSELIELEEVQLIQLIGTKYGSKLYKDLSKIIIGINDKFTSIDDVRFLTYLNKKKPEDVEKQKKCHICQMLTYTLNICSICQYEICLSHTKQSIFSSKYFCINCYNLTTIGKISKFF